MRGRDLHATWATAAPVTPADLARYSVPAEAGALVRRDPLIAPGWRLGAIERTRDVWLIAVRGHGDGSIETPDPARCVREAAILDLIAFDPAAPDRWRAARDAVTVLGAIEPQYLDPPPVPIHPDPLAWLRAGGDGLCLLSRDWREQREVLARCRSGYDVDDPAFGVHLHDLMTRPLVEPPPVYIVRRVA